MLLGGGVAFPENYSVTINNSIIAGNTASGIAPDVLAVGDMANNLIVENSLIGNATGSGITSMTGTGNILNQAALLGPLSGQRGADTDARFAFGAESNATAQSNQVAESLVAPDTASETSVESDSAAATPTVSSPVSQRTISEPMSMSVASPVEVPVARSTSTVKPAADTSNSIQSQDVTGTITSPPAPVDSADNSMASPMVEQSELPVTGPISASAKPVDSYIGPVAFASAKHSFSVDRNSSLNRFKTNGLLALQGSLKGSTERLASSHEQHPVTDVSTDDSFSNAAALFDAHPESLDEIFDFELDDSLAGLI